MTAWAFCLAYNEATLIRYWVRHYREFCDKVIVYVDVNTDDGTETIAKQEGATMRPYSDSTGLDDIRYIDFAQEKYKEARGYADWVIWTDVDEILYHPHMHRRLAELKAHGVNVPVVNGYSMFANQPPVGQGQVYDEIRTGIPSPAYSKVCIFDPMLDIKWTTGKHDATFEQTAIRNVAGEPFKLLHYRWLGKEWHLARNARNYSRLSQENIERQHGRELYPGATGMYSESWYEQNVQLAVDCL
jgi:hypothetical protein